MAKQIKDTFLYFAYGSNLLKKRIHINNPTAELIGIGRLDGHQLDFMKYSDHWRGTSATIVPTENAQIHVWGAVWRLHNCDMPALDRLDFIRYSKFWGGPTATLVPTANAHVWGVIWRLGIEHVATLDEQEGVYRKIYYPKHVQVLTPYMGNFKCRVYIHKVNPLPRGDNEVIPVERWPSWTYKEIIILGAMEHELPEYYIQDLEKIKQNGEKGCLKMYTLLLKFVNEKPCVCDIPKKKEKPQIWISEALRKKIKNK